MELRPGYKQTEVGVIPADWKCAQISELARLESGHTPSKRVPKYWGGNVQWVSLHDTRSLDAGEIRTTAKTITEDGLSNSSARLLPAGTVVFSRTATVGKTTVLASPMATSQDFANYVCGPNLHNRYLVYLFRSMGRTWQSLMAGSIHNTIYMPVFKALRIVLPPVSEQRVIADTLSDADALLAGLERLIAKKRDLKQAAMQQLLTGQTCLPGFIGAWEVKRLGDLFKFSGGHSASRDQLSAKGHCYLHYGDIHGSSKVSIDTNADYQDIPKLNVPLKRVSPDSLLADGDVVFVDASEDDKGTSKHVVVVNKSGLPFISGLHTIVAKAKTDELAHEYRRYCFQTAAIRQQFMFFAVGTKVSGISKTNIVKLTLPVPSVPEQTAIATILSDMDGELSLLTARRDKTRALKQAMMQELLTGRTRLL